MRAQSKFQLSPRVTCLSSLARARLFFRIFAEI